jgi:hypothetical protein
MQKSDRKRLTEIGRWIEAKAGSVALTGLGASQIRQQETGNPMLAPPAAVLA